MSSKSLSERFKRPFKSKKSNREVPPVPESAQRLQITVEPELALQEQEPNLQEQAPGLQEPGPALQEPQLASQEQPSSNPQADQSNPSEAKSESTWDLAIESLKQRRPDLYRDLQDLQEKAESESNLDWLQKVAIECRESRNDAHGRIRTNVESILRSVLAYKDVAIAVSRLDPHGIAPMVLTGGFTVLQAALNGNQGSEEATAAVAKIAALIARWTNQEQISSLRWDVTLKEEFAKLQRSMVDLYVVILECQISLSRYCNKGIFGRVASATYSFDRLRTQLASIKDKDDNCKLYLSAIEAKSAFQEKNAEILKWISPTDPMLMHEDVVARTKIHSKYSDGGEWLLQSEEFKNWETGKNESQILWLFGTVGTGKTTLMSKVVEWHLARSSLYRDTRFAVYYCSDSSGQRSSDSTLILRSLVRQLSLCLDSTVIPEQVRMIYDLSKSKESKEGFLSAENCEKALRAIFQKPVGARVYIDALDECDDSEKVLNAIREILRLENRNIKVCICSRTELRYRAENYFPDACYLEVAKGKTELDMENYIKREVQDREKHLRLLEGKYPKLENELIETLCQRAGGMFRWVELQLSLFLDRKQPFRHPGDVEDSLKQLQKVSVAGEAELNRTYSDIYNRNAVAGRRDNQYARAAYSFVLCAFRMTTFNDLAMTIRWHCAKEKDDNGLDDDAVTPIYLRTISRDFLTESNSTVIEFAHVSVKEYLQTRMHCNEPEFSAKKCHELVAKICLRYLLRPERFLADSEEGLMRSNRARNEEQAENSSESDEDESLRFRMLPFEVFRFEPYAEYYWPAHVKFVDGFMPNTLQMKFLKFIPENLQPSPEYERWAESIRSADKDIGFELEIDDDIDWGRKLLSAVCVPTTPVAAICAFGFLSMIGSLNTLISCDGKREKPTAEVISTLLLVSSEWGMDLAVKLLISQPDLDIDWVANWGGQALYLAANEGHAAVVALLLAQPNIDVNWADELLWTALTCAVARGQRPVVALLLAHPNIDVNLTDIKGWTPLLRAVDKEHTKIVMQLLASPNIKVNCANRFGKTALEMAVYGRNAIVVEALLKRPDTNVNFTNINGETALYEAIFQGNLAVLKLLLSHPHLNPNWANTRGEAPLHLAIDRRELAVVELLLTRPDLDVNKANRQGWTALHGAVDQMDVAMIKLLLARPDLDFHKTNQTGLTVV